MVTLSDFAPLKPATRCGCHSPVPQESTAASNKYDRIDVAVFPLGLVAKQLDAKGASLLMDWLSQERLPTSWSASDSSLPRPPVEHAWLEQTHNRHIFVCTHGSRDYLCGVHGGKLLEEIRRRIDERNLGKHVAAWSTSHIGGHKYAANAIVYPRGDWYGTWCDRCRGMSEEDGPSLNPEADADRIIDAAISDLVWWDAWRGATNMSKQDQIDAWEKHTAGHESVTRRDVEGDASSTFSAWVPNSPLRKRAGDAH
ncbi:hypothetical protein GGI07_005873 [Coemansia sp. Benny D115]|nr:hypothetical protein GGI07_005873 [Coemansia sp. Benny D115]